MHPDKLSGWFMSQHRIVVTPIGHPEFDGLRVTPNVYTTLEEVDLFADKLLEAARKGIT
jgi:isopenicillin-N epimerase